MPPATPVPPATPTPPPAPPPITVPQSTSDMLLPDEHVVTIVHRTIIGLIFIYLEALVAVVALIALVILVFPTLFSSLSANSNALLVAGAVFGLALLFFILFLVTYIYRQNRFILTDKSLVQTLQKTLFIRKVSRLSMSNVEDVNANQQGIFQTIFNYGTLNIQTAGTIDNFVFPYCPDPNTFCEQILAAREAYAKALQEEAGGP